MEKAFQLLEEEKVNSAIEFIQEKLSEDNDEFKERLINDLNRLSSKNIVILRSLYPNLLKLIGMDNDVLRYSLLLSLKPLCDSEPELIVSFAKEYLQHENDNAKESMLQLLEFAARKNPDDIMELADNVIDFLASEQDFLQKKASDVLKALGKHYNLEIEQKLVDFVGSTTNKQIRENAEAVLKDIVSLKDLEEEEIEKKQMEVAKKVLDEKDKKLTEEEIKIQEDEIKKREELVSIKKESKEKQDELKKKEQELLEKEQELREKELKLKEAALFVEEKEKEVVEEKIRQKVEQLEKEIEINRKKAELERVKKELELKKLEEEETKIIEEEKSRIEKKLKEMQSEQDHPDEYEEIGHTDKDKS